MNILALAGELGENVVSNGLLGPGDQAPDFTPNVCLRGEIIMGPVVTGEIIQGPVVTGEIITGPVVEGEIITGPVCQGEIIMGPILTGRVIGKCE